MDVSILIVSYNTRDLLTACLRSLHQETVEVSFEVVVVDNNSPDGSAESVRREFPQVRLHASTENLGFARANNVAAQMARGEYLLLLNPDTVILDRAIDRLVACARRQPDAGIWGGRTVFADGSLNATCCYNHTTLWSLFCRASGLNVLFRSCAWFNREEFGGWRYDSLRRVDIITGCFFLIRRDFWNELGGFDPLFYMYGEEVDLCLRAAAKGARPLFTPAATIVHYGGASEASQVLRASKVLRAKVALMKKHWSPGRRWLGRRLLLAWTFTRYAGAQACRGLLGKSVPSLEKWTHLWRTRHEWLRGFETPS
jgi:hypothetical protein